MCYFNAPSIQISTMDENKLQMALELISTLFYCFVKTSTDDLLSNTTLSMTKKASDHLLSLRGLPLFKIIYNRKCDAALGFAMASSSIILFLT